MPLAHSTFGHGPDKVLVIHDFLGDSRNYEPMRPYLDASAYTYVFVDLRGYGGSRQLEGEHNCHEAARDVIATANQLDWSHFFVVAHSMSSLIALQAAQLCPDRVRGLVLIGPVPPEGLAVSEDVLAMMHHMLDDETVRRQGLAAMWGDRLSSRWLEFKARRWSECVTNDAAHHYLDMFTGTDIAAEVAGLETPMLVVAGEHDREAFAPTSLREAFVGRFPHAQLQVCRNAGHYPMQETPVYLATVMERFFKACA